MTDARAITEALRGRWYRSYESAPCPVCQPESRKGQNALTLSDGRDGRLLAHCKRSGCDFADILAAAGISPGSYTPPDPVEIARRGAQAKAEAEKRERQALAICREALPIHGTPAETYLRGRGITCPLPSSLRFHPECWHGPSARRWPAMVALAEGSDRAAVHRTYLGQDARSKADLNPAKMMLGAVSGGAVRLSEAEGPLVVAEGIETALSLACGLLRGPATIWAALSASGIAGLRLPDHPHRLTVATDGDDAGRAAGNRLAERAIALGWSVSLLPAPDGRDWNDILTKKGASA